MGYKIYWNEIMIITKIVLLAFILADISFCLCSEKFIYVKKKKKILTILNHYFYKSDFHGQMLRGKHCKFLSTF